MRDAPTSVREVGSCVLCNGPDTLDLAVCLDCASRTGDGLVFVRQSIRKAEHARVIEHLHGILPPGVEWEAFKLATKGYLPLASVPLPAAEQVLGAFARKSVPAQLIPRRWGVAPIPPGLGLISAPVRTDTSVTSVRSIDDGYVVATNQGDWHCRAVVIASGACNVARVPAVAEGVPSSITTLTPLEYRNPDQLERGGVLVVGASASGTQIAAEIHGSGRPVTLALGEHVRVPRVYRGRDIEWWMDAAGVLDEFYTEVDNLLRVRNVPSLQLAGSDDRRTVDLNSLTDVGVKLIGRFAGINDGRAQFSGALRNLCEMSDLKMNRLLDRIDEWESENPFDEEVPPPHRFEPTRVEASPPLGMDLNGGEIRTIIWATGFRPDHSWLDVAVSTERAASGTTVAWLRLPGCI